MGIGASNTKSSSAGEPTTTTSVTVAMGGCTDPDVHRSSKNIAHSAIADVTTTVPDFPGQVNESVSETQGSTVDEKRARWRNQSQKDVANDNRKDLNPIGLSSSSNIIPAWKTTTDESANRLSQSSRPYGVAASNRIGGLSWKDSAALRTPPPVASTSREGNGLASAAHGECAVGNGFERSSVFVMNAAAAAAAQDKDLRKLLSWDRTSNQEVPNTNTLSKPRYAGGDSTSYTDFETHWSDDGDILAIVVPSTWKSNGGAGAAHRRKDSASSLDEDIREIERTVSVDSELEGAALTTRSAGQQHRRKRSVASSPSACDRTIAAAAPHRGCVTTPAQSRHEETLHSADQIDTPNQEKDLGDTPSDRKSLQKSPETNETTGKEVTPATNSGTSTSRSTTARLGVGTNAVRPTSRPGPLRRASIFPESMKFGVKLTDKVSGQLVESSTMASKAETTANEIINEWSYRQPKIDGFDPVKFKEANSRNNLSSNTRHITLPL